MGVPKTQVSTHLNFEFEYMEIIYVYCGLKKCMNATLEVMNPTYVEVKIRPEKKFRPVRDLNP